MQVSHAGLHQPSEKRARWVLSGVPQSTHDQGVPPDADGDFEGGIHFLLRTFWATRSCLAYWRCVGLQ